MNYSYLYLVELRSGYTKNLAKEMEKLIATTTNQG